jgi:outer membrane protein TolC
MWDDAEHRWMVGASVNLPVRGERTRAGIAESEARWHAARGARERLEIAVRSEVHQAWLRVLESHHTLDLFRSRLLPATEDALRAALASFESGVSSSLAVIEAEKTRRSTELGYERALADLYQRLAELDGAVGRMPGGWSAEGVE